jgi:hypothetical protein
VKWFGFEREKNEPGLAVFVDHRMPFEAGKTWHMPYHVRTSFDWTIPPLRLCGLVFEPDQ